MPPTGHTLPAPGVSSSGSRALPVLAFPLNVYNKLSSSRVRSLTAFASEGWWLDGVPGVFRGCNTLSLERGSGTGYKAVFSQCQAVFSQSVHFSVCSGQCQLKCSLLLFRRSVASNPLQPHGLQHSRLPCPSPFPRACSNSCPLCQWCHPTISSSVIPFSSCLQSFPASGSFLMSRLFTWSGQNIGASASVSVLPMNIQDWFPMELTGLILQCKGFSRDSPRPQL